METSWDEVRHLNHLDSVGTHPTGISYPTFSTTTYSFTSRQGLGLYTVRCNGDFAPGSAFELAGLVSRELQDRMRENLK